MVLSDWAFTACIPALYNENLHGFCSVLSCFMRCHWGHPWAAFLSPFLCLRILALSPDWFSQEVRYQPCADRTW